MFLGCCDIVSCVVITGSRVFDLWVGGNVVLFGSEAKFVASRF